MPPALPGDIYGAILTPSNWPVAMLSHGWNGSNTKVWNAQSAGVLGIEVGEVGHHEPHLSKGVRHAGL